MAAEVTLDGGGNHIVRLAAVRRQDGPEQAVVGMSAAVVADGVAHPLGQGPDIGNQRIDVGALDAGIGERRIEVGDVGLMVLGMMDFHRACIEVRFECVVGVGQGGEGVGHGYLRKCRWGRCRHAARSCFGVAVVVRWRHDRTSSMIEVKRREVEQCGLFTRDRCLSFTRTGYHCPSNLPG